MSTKLPIALPPGKTVRNIGGTNFLVSKRRGGHKFKLPAVTRRKMAASARRIKIPVVTVAINAPPLFDAADQLFKSGVTMKDKGRNIFNALRPYHGFSLFSTGKTQWRLGDMWAVGANLGFQLVKRTGIFKGANTALAKTKMPFRLA